MKCFSKSSFCTWGWVFISGLLLGFSQPFFTENFSLADINWLGALALVAYVPLLLVVAQANLKHAFFQSFVAIFIQYSIVVFWIYIAVHVHGHVAAVPSVLVTMGLAWLMAVKGAVFFTAGRFLSQRFNISFLWLAPFTICALEYFKNFYVFNGFPWGNAGYSLGRIDEFLQLASLVGVYGIVFWAALVNSLLALALEREKKVVYLVAALSLVILAYAYGITRISQGKNEFAPSIKVAILQGNIPQEIKNDSRLYADDIMAIYLKMQRKAKEEGAKIVIWPEAAHPRMLKKDIKDLGLKDEEQIASIIGATVYGQTDGKFYAHNSALLLNSNGLVVRRYDKSHLVPFGEYVPWPFNGLVDEIVPGMGAFLPGTEFVPEKLSLGLADQLMIGTTICYEGIFPEISRAYAQNGASLLVNLTNDAWYGLSSAPYQHLLMYRMRSVESGLPFIRSTNSGISAWIDVYGRIHKPTRLFEREMILADVALIKKDTLYVAIGDVFAQLSMLLLILGYVVALVPIHRFIRESQWGKVLIVLALASVMVGFSIYYSSVRFLTDESARTKNLIVFILCLLFLIGLLSKTQRSRSILMASGTVLILFSLLLVFYESVYFLLGILLGLLIYLLAFRIKPKPTV